MRLIALALLLAASPALAHDGGAGAPGDARKAGRVVEVTASETNAGMSFSPDRVAIAAGEQVRFHVRNAGALEHEFVLGTKAQNAAHGRMMAEMPDMKHHDANAVTIAPGRSATLTWRFARGGEFEFACLIPGHYEAGMHGAVTVK